MTRDLTDLMYSADETDEARMRALIWGLDRIEAACQPNNKPDSCEEITSCRLETQLPT